MPMKGWFDFYSRKFSSVEVNSTFYHFPSEKVIKAWAAKGSANFRFTLKAPGLITHRKKFSGTQKLVNLFCRRARILDKKLGCILWQLPPFMHKNLDRLEGICKQLDEGMLNAIEFRHETWFDEETIALLKDYGIAFCNVSSPELPETAHVTAKHAYFRFHGKGGWYDFNYPAMELRKWAEKMQKLKCKSLWVYFNNDSDANAPRNCLKLAEMLMPK
jgi:uncharacterized protein YecE (DUF72 family)